MLAFVRVRKDPCTVPKGVRVDVSQKQSTTNQKTPVHKTFCVLKKGFKKGILTHFRGVPELVTSCGVSRLLFLVITLASTCLGGVVVPCKG